MKPRDEDTASTVLRLLRGPLSPAMSYLMILLLVSPEVFIIDAAAPVIFLLGESTPVLTLGFFSSSLAFRRDPSLVFPCLIYLPSVSWSLERFGGTTSTLYRAALRSQRITASLSAYGLLASRRSLSPLCFSRVMVPGLPTSLVGPSPGFTGEMWISIWQVSLRLMLRFPLGH